MIGWILVVQIRWLNWLFEAEKRLVQWWAREPKERL